MRKSVKKTIEVILAILACVSFVLMVAERPDGSVCLPWTLGWLAVLAICAKILERMGAFNKQTNI